MTKKVKVYVNFYDREVLTEKEFKRKLDRERRHLMNEDDDFFDEWLSNNFTHVELWNLTPPQRLRLLDDFNQECIKQAKEKLFDDEWEEVEIEVEI